MIHILGNGDLSKEFISFSDFNSDEIKVYSKEEFTSKKFKNYISKQDKLFIPIADPIIRKKVFGYIMSLGIIPSTFIHPSVIVGKRSKIGIGCIIQPNTIISNDVFIGDSVFVNMNTNIAHDVKILNHSSIMVNVNIGGNCEIGEQVFIGTGVSLKPNIKIISSVKIGIGSVVIKNIKRHGT